MIAMQKVIANQNFREILCWKFGRCALFDCVPFTDSCIIIVFSSVFV
jgi:hypothetical protein